MPMPTRRAIRPDGRYYRDSRRVRLSTTRSGRASGDPALLRIAAITFVLFLAAAGYSRFNAPHGVWLSLIEYGTGGVFLIAVVLAYLIRR